MLPITVANLVLLLGAMVAMVLLDPVLGLAASASVPVVIVVVNTYSRRVIGVSTEVQERLADLSSVVEEAIAGVRVVKAYGQEQQEVDRLTRSADAIYTTTMDMQRIRSKFVPIFALVPTAASVLILWLGGTRVVTGAMTIGAFVAFTQYMQVLVFPMRITGWFFAQLPRAAAAANRVSDLLSTAPEIADAADPLELPPGRGDVRFSGVRFAYPGGGEVLSKLDLHLAPGQSVAVVGSTGSGKSTLAYLLPRFYDVDAG